MNTCDYNNNGNNEGDDDGDQDDDDDDDYNGDCSSRTTPRVSYHKSLIINLPIFHVIWQIEPPPAVVVGYVFCGEW